jgi:translation initiation factor IF-2
LPARWTSSAPTRSRARIVHSGAGAHHRIRRLAGRSVGAPRSSASTSAPTRRPGRGRTRGIEIRYYNIIYDLVDDVKAAMSGLLSPERRETFLGNAEILEVFNITKVGKVAGCRVTEGKVERGAACA